MLVTVSLTFLLAGALGEDKTWQSPKYSFKESKVFLVLKDLSVSHLGIVKYLEDNQ